MDKISHQVKANRFTKSRKPTIGRGLPPSSFGADGDLSFRIIGNDTKLLIKANGKWHGIKIGDSFDKLERELEKIKESLGPANNIRQLNSLSVKDQLKSERVKLVDFGTKDDIADSDTGTGTLWVKGDVLKFTDDNANV